MADDKRRFPRIQSLNIVADQGKVFRTLDLSREGMLVEMDVPTAIGTRIQLDLALGQPLLGRGCLTLRTMPIAAGVVGDESM